MVEKNVRKVEAAKQRNMSGFNTGTRTMKSAKYPNRQKRKKDFQKLLDNLMKEWYNQYIK